VIDPITGIQPVLFASKLNCSIDLIEEGIKEVKGARVTFPFVRIYIFFFTYLSKRNSEKIKKTGMSLLFLSTEDFTTTKDANDNIILCHSINGFCLLLFFSNQCVYCKDILPIFSRLPHSVPGCNFGLVNVSMNRSLVNISKQTTSPIQYVPFIVLYLNGRPYMQYKGPSNEAEIRKFIIQVSKDVMQSGFIQTAKANNIPTYTIGQPLCGEDDGVCYFEFNEAKGYHSKSV